MEGCLSWVPASRVKARGRAGARACALDLLRAEHPLFSRGGEPDCALSLALRSPPTSLSLYLTNSLINLIKILLPPQIDPKHILNPLKTLHPNLLSDLDHRRPRHVGAHEGRAGGFEDAGFFTADLCVFCCCLSSQGVRTVLVYTQKRVLITNNARLNASLCNDYLSFGEDQ